MIQGVSIQAVVFDIGGVLEITQSLVVGESWEARLGLQPGAMAERMGHPRGPVPGQRPGHQGHRGTAQREVANAGQARPGDGAPMVGLATAAFATKPTGPRTSWTTQCPAATPRSLMCPAGWMPTYSPCGSRPR